MVMKFEAATKIEQEYTFPCKMQVAHKTVHDFDKDLNPIKYEMSIVNFIPQAVDSSMASLFLDAWLPSAEGEKQEVVAIILSPVNKPARMIIKRSSKECYEPHLMLSTVDLKETVEKVMKYHEKINIAVQPASKEEMFNV